MLSFQRTLTIFGLLDASEGPSISGNMNPPFAGFPIPDHSGTSQLRQPAALGCPASLPAKYADVQNTALHTCVIVCLPKKT